MGFDGENNLRVGNLRGNAAGAEVEGGAQGSVRRRQPIRIGNVAPLLLDAQRIEGAQY